MTADSTTKLREALKSAVAGKPCDTGVLADAILTTLVEHRDDVLDVLGMTDDDGQWVLVKSSRGYDGGLGYTGPSWEAAGLTVPTAPFTRWADAQEAREALDRVNAVGWRIAAFRPKEQP